MMIFVINEKVTNFCEKKKLNLPKKKNKFIKCQGKFSLVLRPYKYFFFHIYKPCHNVLALKVWWTLRVTKHTRKPKKTTHPRSRACDSMFIKWPMMRRQIPFVENGEWKWLKIFSHMKKFPQYFVLTRSLVQVAGKLQFFTCQKKKEREPREGKKWNLNFLHFISPINGHERVSNSSNAPFTRINELYTRSFFFLNINYFS